MPEEQGGVDTEEKPMISRAYNYKPVFSTNTSPQTEKVKKLREESMKREKVEGYDDDLVENTGVMDLGPEELQKVVRCPLNFVVKMSSEVTTDMALEYMPRRERLTKSINRQKIYMCNETADHTIRTLKYELRGRHGSEKLEGMGLSYGDKIREEGEDWNVLDMVTARFSMLKEEVDRRVSFP